MTGAANEPNTYLGWTLPKNNLDTGRDNAQMFHQMFWRIWKSRGYNLPSQQQNHDITKWYVIHCAVQSG